MLLFVEIVDGDGNIIAEDELDGTEDQHGFHVKRDSTPPFFLRVYSPHIDRIGVGNLRGVDVGVRKGDAIIVTQFYFQ